MDPSEHPSSSPPMISSSDPLTSPYASLNSHCFDLTTLQSLASRGAWRTILDKITLTRSQSLLSHPHEHLIYLTFNLLALTKLRRFSDAQTDLDSHLENLDSPKYHYSTYPSIYPSHPPSSSMIPFALRIIHAHLPFSLNNRDLGLDRLYGLLLFTRGRKKLGECLGVWREREIYVLNLIINYHLGVKEFKVCLDLLRELMGDEEYAGDARVVAKTGYVQMQYGDLEGARRTFGVVEEVVGEKGDVGLRNLVGRNKALMYIVEKDYVSAIREYDECIERDGSDAVAINNKALCLMYLRDLSDGIKVLENALERVPTTVLNETIVGNLCSMYELAYVNHADVKKTLSSWMARVAPDDFDTSCTRI